MHIPNAQRIHGAEPVSLHRSAVFRTPLTQQSSLVRPEADPAVPQLVPPHWSHSRGQLGHVQEGGGEAEDVVPLA